MKQTCEGLRHGARIGITAGTVLALMSLLVGCSGGSAESSSDVPWQDYDASVKTRIDALADGRDCVGLQEQFDIADDNNAITMARTGHNNAALMGHIDDRMRIAGCY